MKFRVTRASSYSVDKISPCDGAVLEPYTRNDIRSWSSYETISNENVKRDWLTHGANHREVVYRGEKCIVRDFEAEGWFIELETMEDLVEFVEKEDNIVIGLDDVSLNHMRPTIYDDYL